HRESVEIGLGYGDPEKTVTATIQPGHAKVAVNQWVWENKYSAEVSFPANNTAYTLSMYDANLIAGYQNVNKGTSATVPLQLQTTLHTGRNAHSPVFDSILYDQVNVGAKYQFNGGIYDADGDSLVFNLIDEDSKYVYPSRIGPGVQSFYARKNTVYWNTPEKEGYYLAKFKVVEYQRSGFSNKKTPTILSETEVYLCLICYNTASSIDQPVSKNQLVAYGNGGLTYTGSTKRNSVSIYNLTGQLVLRQQNLSTGSQISLPQKQGIYLLHVQSDEGEITQKVFVR
ncbi:T9SS type A sorting domain-containing protein, partial [bacterium]|nr:T9SS type A sorting domain-containing protein [bacterium]